MAVISNVDMETGDERRNSMNREVFRHVMAALNAIDRFEGELIDYLLTFLIILLDLI